MEISCTRGRGRGRGGFGWGKPPPSFISILGVLCRTKGPQTLAPVWTSHYATHSGFKAGDEQSQSALHQYMTDAARLQGSLDAEKDKAEALNQQVTCLTELLQKMKESAAEQTAAAKKGEAVARDEMRRMAEQHHSALQALQRQLSAREESCEQHAASATSLIAEVQRLEVDLRQQQLALVEAQATEQRQTSEINKLTAELVEVWSRGDFLGPLVV